MNYSKNTYIIIAVLIFLLQSGFCNAQHSVDLSDVDLIIYNKLGIEIRFFQEKTKDEFTELHLFLDDNYDDMYISTEIGYDEESKKLSEIEVNEDEIMLFKDEIKETNFRDLLTIQSEVVANWDKDGEDDNKLVLKFLNESFSVIQEMYFGKNESPGGFGSFTRYEDDSLDKWRVYYANYFTTIDLDFGNNKHIYLLNDGDDTEYIYLPLKTSNYLLSDDDGISDLLNTSKYKMSYLDNFSFFEYDNFISLHKEGDKYKLLNNFKEDLLKVAYDTIIYNEFFVIGKNNNQIDIYNSNYQKTPITNAKSAYLYRSGLEILNDKGASYYNSELKIIDEFPPLSYLVCGTVGEISYEIESGELTDFHTLTKTNGGFATNLDEKRTYYLKDLNINDKVTFLTSNNKYQWDGNDSFVGSNYAFPEFLKITRGKKSGIFEYEYTDAAAALDTLKKEWKNEVTYVPETIEGKVMLPINNDSIIFNNTDGLIYFYRKNKVGIYPRHKKAQYETIKQLTNSFYAISRKQKNGWLDIETNMEYFEN